MSRSVLQIAAIHGRFGADAMTLATGTTYAAQTHLNHVGKELQ